MHSRNVLIALTMASLVAVLAVLIDGAIDEPALHRTRKIVPEFADAGPVARITWERPEQEPLIIARDSDGRFIAPDAARAVVEQAAIRAVLDTLDTMTYARRQQLSSTEYQARGLAKPALVMTVDFLDGRSLIISLGQRIVETDRVWLASAWSQSSDRAQGDSPAYLVDGYLARALDRQPRDVRKRQIFTVFHEDIESIAMSRGDMHMHIFGRPARVQLGQRKRDSVLMDTDAFTGLARDLSELSISHFAAPSRAKREARVAADEAVTLIVTSEGQSVTLSVISNCPDRPDMFLCSTSIGDGCVPSAPLESIAARLANPPALLATTPLAGGRPAVMTISEQGRAPLTIRAVGRAWAWAENSDGPDIETRAVDTWLRHLERASSSRYVWPEPRTVEAADDYARSLGAPRLSARLTRADGSRYALRIFRAERPRSSARGPLYLARRDREPGFLALEQQPHVDALWPISPTRFQRQQVLNREPFGLRAVTLKRSGAPVTELRRGQLLDDWQVIAPTDAHVRPETMDRLRELARLRARSFASATANSAHGLKPARARIWLRFDPGPFDENDSASEHLIEIGAQTGGGCFARLDASGPVFVLEAADCNLLLQPLTRPGPAQSP